MKKDKVFIAVTALVLGNLVFWLGSIISYIWQHPTNTFSWALAIADVVAIIGVIYLMRTYLRARKKTRGQENVQPKEDK